MKNMVRVIGLLAATVCIVSGLLALVSAKEYVVGDDAGWNSDVDYYQWLARKTFYVGDVLVFKYSKEDHNVIIVNATGYDQCVASPNLGALTSGNDRISLSNPGYKYYICEWHCDYSDQKLMLNVLPKKGAPMSSSPPLACPPSPTKHGVRKYWWWWRF